MSAFARGFQMGGDIFANSERMRLAQEQEARQQRESAARLEQMGLQTEQLRRAAARDNEMTRLRSEISDFASGLNRPATNAALDADFDQALAASTQATLNENLVRNADKARAAGLTVPDSLPSYSAAAPMTRSNVENEAALAVRDRVNVNSPEYQSGMAGLRQRYALLAGDMKDFDAITTAERNRLTAREDSDFALDVVKNPTGSAAVQARTFINAQTKGFTIDPPNKEGISTLRIIQGDRTKPIDISPSDLSKIAVGVRRLERGDVGGLDVIAAVNKDVAAAVRAEMGTQLEVLKANNDANFKTAGLRNDAARTANAAAQTANQAEYYRAMRDRYNRPQAGDLREFVNDKGEVTLVDITGLPRREDGTIPLPAGLRPRTNKPTVDPKDYAATIKSFTEAGLDLPQARMQADRLYGLTAPTQEVAAQLKALNDSKARPADGARAPAAAPAAPLGLQQRLANAITTDNAAGNRNRFSDLADEGMRQMPAINSQLGALYRALPLARTESERGSLQAQIEQLERDAAIYNGIITQRRAQMGL